MKQILFINQIAWFLSNIKLEKETLLKQRIEDAERESDKVIMTNIGYRNQFAMLNGADEALKKIDISSDIHSCIIDSIKEYHEIEKSIKVNFIDDNDPNFEQFYTTAGALNKLYILLTISDNSQSACPVNKDILLKEAIGDMEIKITNANLNKDKKSAAEFKVELGILNKLYSDNLKLLKNKTYRYKVMLDSYPGGVLEQTDDFDRAMTVAKRDRNSYIIDAEDDINTQ